METIADRVVAEMAESVKEAASKTHDHNAARDRINDKYGDFPTWYDKISSEGDSKCIMDKLI